MIFRIKHIVSLFALIIVIAYSCKKTEVVHENKIITGNSVPQDTSVPLLIVKNFVNKLYIDIIGREPTDTELNSNVDYLVTNGLSTQSKTTTVETVISNDEYHKRLFEILSIEMIGGIDSGDIAEQITLFTLVMEASTDSIEKVILGIELARLDKISTAREDYKNDLIEVNDYYKRFIDNPFYDDINMGSENFVLATFENLYNRFPTVSELEEGIEMVENTSTAIFLQDGSNKDDFMNIVTTYQEFYEGVITNNYITLLQREPTSSEINDQLLNFIQTKNLQGLQKDILIKKEYAGF